MPFELWGVTGTPSLVLPARLVPGTALLLLYTLAIAWLTYQQRVDFAHLRLQRRWLFTLLLAISAFLVAQFLPFANPATSQLRLLSTADSPAVAAPFGFIPVLLAGLSISPVAAMIVAFFGGLSRALFQTHHVFTPFYYALAGLAAGWLLQQNFQQRIYQFLRQPIVAGPLVLSLGLLLPIILSSFAYSSPEVSNLAALDLATSTAAAYVLPLFIEGLVSGAIISLVLYGEPRLRQRSLPSAPSPQDRSLRWRLVIGFSSFAIITTIFLLTLVFRVSVLVSTGLVVDQMARNAANVSHQIMDFVAERQNLLRQFGQNSALLEEESDATLEQLFRTAPFFRRVLLVSADGEVIDYYPDDAESIQLTPLEEIALDNALRQRSPTSGAGQMSEIDGTGVSFVAPVSASDTIAAIIGRTPQVSLNELSGALQGTTGEGRGFIVDDLGQIIAHPNQESLLTTWSPPDNAPDTDISGPEVPGTAYRGRQGDTNTREIVYYQPGNGWLVVTTAPNEIILGMALSVAWPLALTMIFAVTVFLGYLTVFSRSITGPLHALGQVTERIASGNLETPISVTGEDEIGRLGDAFATMQKALQERMDELSLLLNVSQNAVNSLDLRQAMPPILQGAIRATGASSARIVVQNPQGGHPLIFAEGPSTHELSAYDRRIMSATANKDEIVCQSAVDVINLLDANPDEPAPLRALVALAIRTAQERRGVFWLGFRQPHHAEEREVNLLKTLAGQASVIVENGLLFAAAEGQRRRLAAVLLSTTNAVIVTEHTDRVLLVNPAMEHLFNIRSSQVIGRPVGRVLPATELVAALTGQEIPQKMLEVPVENSGTWSANISTITSQNGQTMGRVAVLHDITALKEVDELKSEFVQTVSHDLRSPLTYLRGYATMLQTSEDGFQHQRHDEFVAKILQGIDQMEAMVSNLLNLSSIEAGVDLTMVDIEVSQLVAGVYADFVKPAEDAGLNLRMQVPSNLPPVVGDTTLLREALGNFIGNAIKYAPNSGDLTIRATLRPARGDAPAMVVIGVEDHGPGVAAKDLGLLFDKFYRVRSRETARVKGNGLGLAIVSKIAERHGGHAWAESDEGQGTTFYFSLPAKISVSNGQVKEPA